MKKVNEFVCDEGVYRKSYVYNENEDLFKKAKMQTIELTEQIPKKGEYDIIVAGGGVAGAAAAVRAARLGKSVLLLEKTLMLGGLATNGLINFFVPMCNGRGKVVMKGMVEEFLRLSIRYGYEKIPTEWQGGTPEEEPKARYTCRYSAGMFALALNELLAKEGVKVLFDTALTRPVTEGGHICGVVTENKSGREYYEAKMFIDATGDGDLLYRAGVPTVQGQNYHTYLAHGATMESVQRTAETGDMADLPVRFAGGGANLHGGGHPEGMPYYTGTDGEDVSHYVRNNQLELLEHLRGDDRKVRDIHVLPGVCQFRTTRHIDGDYTLKESDTYRHFPDSVSAICDFERRDYLFEVPYHTLIKTGFDNIITAGRSAAAEGYAWDVLRVIPPAILTGQAAGVAAAQAIDAGVGIDELPIAPLQKQLEEDGVLIHFPDKWIPKDTETAGEHVDSGEEA